MNIFFYIKKINLLQTNIKKLFKMYFILLGILKITYYFRIFFLFIHHSKITIKL